MLEPILTAVVPVLVTIAVGVAWARAGRPFASDQLTPLLADVATPCLIFATLAKTRVVPGAFAATALAGATAIAGAAVVGALVLRIAGWRWRTYLPSVTFPNAGNLGLPLALSAFGPEGLSHAIVFFAISSVGNYTVGQAISAGSSQWRALLRMPLLYAVAGGVAVSYWQVPLPRWAGNAVSLIGQATVPLMLLMLGASLGRLHVAAFRRAAAVSAMRIGVGAVIGILVTRLYGLEGTVKSVVIMQCAMPVALYCYVFAARWDSEPDEVAGLVVVSTVASVFTVPLLLGFLM